jgi:toxin ParE1/3/4
MKILFTEEALRNIEEILAYLHSAFPEAVVGFEHRLRGIEARLRMWPESAREVAQRPGVRVIPMVRYPYKVFYRVGVDRIEILHVHHASRKDPV